MTTSEHHTGQSWITAAIGGAVVAVFLAVVGSGVLVAVVAGLVIFGVGMLLLPRGGVSQTEETRVVRVPVTAADSPADAPDHEASEPDQAERATDKGTRRFEENTASA